MSFAQTHDNRSLWLIGYSYKVLHYSLEVNEGTPNLNYDVKHISSRKARSLVITDGLC